MRYNNAIRLLLLLCMPNPAPGMLGEARRTADAGLDWERLARAAISHGTAPVVYENLGSLYGVPPDVVRTLKAAYAGSLRMSELYRHELGELAEALTEAGVEFVLLKGAVQAGELFGDPALYPSEDIDLLVKAGGFCRAAATLGNMGFEPEHEVDGRFLKKYRGTAFFAPGRRPAELHLTLGKARYFSIPDEHWWHGLRDIKIEDGGAHYKTLSHERAFLYASIHLASHGYAPLKFLVVLAQMLRLYGDALDWDSLFEDARSFSASEVMLLTICLAKNLLGAPVPKGVRDRLDARSIKEKMIYRVIEGSALKENANLSKVMFLTMLIGRNPTGLLGGLLRLAFPPPQEIAHRYGLPPGSPRLLWYYLMNPFYLLIKKRGH